MKPPKLLLLMLLAPALLAAAQTPPQQPTLTLHSQSQLVVLDVVVTDKHGDPLLGLSQQDFQVYEDRAPQPIVSFEPAHAPTPLSQPVSSTAELDRVAPDAPVTIIVLDGVSLHAEDIGFAYAALKSYLHSEGDQLTEPTMLVSVTLEHHNLLLDYSTSRAAVLDALKRGFPASAAEADNPLYSGMQMTASLLSLSGVAQATSGHRGHKNIVWVGRGFPPLDWAGMKDDAQLHYHQAITACINHLRDARATLYAVDPAGVAKAQPMFHVSESQAEVGDGDFGTIQDPFGGQADFDSIAVATGGRALHGLNNVDHLITQSVRDGQLFYTLTYKPTVLSSDPKEFRAIRVVMRDRTLIASTREGYYGGRADTGPALDTHGKLNETAALDMAVAADGLMIYDAIRVTLDHDSDPATPDGFVIHFAADSVPWHGEGPARRADVLLLVASYDAKGHQLARTQKVLGFTAAAVAEGAADQRSMKIHITVPNSRAAARVRVVVRSATGTQMGSANWVPQATASTR